MYQCIGTPDDLTDLSFIGSTMPSPRTLMIQGTTSDAGKTTLVAALCRLLARRGVSVAPFKPQNMALNSAVTVDGGEIGRSQALQAYAAGIAPHTDMNPILLKPSSDRASQVIVQGKAREDMDARTYHRYKPQAMLAVLESYERLCTRYEAVLVEGAGSPAEINLREGDIANMGFAERVDCPVLLVADIDRGGVFAHLVGTVEVLAPSEQARIVGFVINRFRGDPALLEPGIRWLEARTGKPVLAVLPFLTGLFLDAEDALPTNKKQHATSALRVIAPAFPRISNATDMDALRLNPAVAFDFIRAGQNVPPADLIVLPGSKSVRSDLAWLRQNGWENAIKKHLRYGGKVIGICGGLQMLGKQVHDPSGLEGPAGSSRGLDLLDFETTITGEKRLANVKGCLNLEGRPAVAGYEIHMGVSTGPALADPRQAAITLDDGTPAGKVEGVRSLDEQIFATYLHGLFDLPEAATALLRWAMPDHEAQAGAVDLAARRAQDLDRLTDAVEAAFDLPRLSTWLPLGNPA